MECSGSSRLTHSFDAVAACESAVDVAEESLRCCAEVTPSGLNVLHIDPACSDDPVSIMERLLDAWPHVVFGIVQQQTVDEADRLLTVTSRQSEEVVVLLYGDDSEGIVLLLARDAPVDELVSTLESTVDCTVACDDCRD